MKISSKIWSLVAVAAVAIVLQAGITYYKSNHVKADADYLTQHIVPSLVVLNDLEHSFAQARYAVLFHIAQTDAAGKQQVATQFAGHLQKLDQAVAQYEAKVSDEAERTNLAALKQELDAWRPLTTKVLEVSDSLDATFATQLIREKCAPQAERVYQALAKLEEYKKQATAQAEQTAAQDIASLITSLLLVGSALLLVIVILGLLIVRSVRVPLGQLQQFLQQLSQDHDFTRRLNDQSPDEIGASLRSLNRVLDAMQHSLQQLSRVGREVSGSVNSLSTTSHEMSQTSNAVSESASAMAAGIEQVTVSISHVADRAQECDYTAREAGRLAAAGGSVIENTISSINQIADQVRTSAAQIDSLKERTATINAVVNVIKDIADQTNLLALNAAIEAARAGDLGRGFAVVADEVRKLAERTASSTQEIISTVAAIQNEANSTVNSMQLTVRQVDDGVAKAQQASGAIADIRRSADSVVEQVSEISTAMREQSAASSAMAQQVERVAQMSEESSAAAASTAQESARLGELGRTLDQSIAVYRV
ncbi:methyl-accepting chemotaxis protein [Chitinibacter sp. SCUT-21]|uniref:HAMP domain-containing methyl-accepting chemotaxis protein n=1 Tax=Chitinibacter sp. SCUT-21 TaxID=2970891 RepID=UPI0035A72986